MKKRETLAHKQDVLDLLAAQNMFENCGVNAKRVTTNSANNFNNLPPKHLTPPVMLNSEKQKTLRRVFSYQVPPSQAIGVVASSQIGLSSQKVRREGWLSGKHL